MITYSPRRDFYAVRLPLALAAGLHLCLAVSAWFHGPAMNSDSATGFLIWDAWRDGLPWNHSRFPDPADLTRDLSQFLAWWSPGQYLAVAPLQFLGLNLGQSIATGTLLWSLAGLAGWHRLFRLFGFDPGIAAWSTALVAVNWTLVRNYGDYMGGELCLLSLAPWLILGLWRSSSAPTKPGALLATLLVWLGAMAKNTFLPVAGGVLLARRWPAIASSALPRRALELAAVATVLAAGHALFWWTFLRHGWNPSSGGVGGITPDAALNLVRLLSFPLGGLASAQNLLGRVFFHPSAPLASGWHDLWLFLVPLGLGFFALTLLLIRRELRLRPDYGRLLACATGGSLAFFALFAVTREAGGLEERFLRPCSFLLAPAALAALAGSGSRLIRTALTLLLFLGATYGSASGPVRAYYLWRLDACGGAGVSQHVLGKEALAELRRLDGELPAGSLIVVSSPEMAFEIVRCRRWATHLEMMPVEFTAPARMHGRAPSLVLVVGPGARSSGRDRELLDRLVDYDPAGWRETRMGDCSFFRQDTVPTSP